MGLPTRVSSRRRDGFGHQHPCRAQQPPNELRPTPRELHGGEEPGEQPALADPGNADERHELPRPLRAGALERGDEQLQLTVASHERGRRGTRHVDAEAGEGDYAVFEILY